VALVPRAFPGCGLSRLRGDAVLFGAQDPNVESWGTEEEDDGDPPRLWAPNATYPGTAFTRSIGDSGKWGTAAPRRTGARGPLSSGRATSEA
jgi:hypothetical protein